MSEATRAGVVLAGTGGVWQVRLQDGTVVECALRGRLKVRRRDEQQEGEVNVKLAVGDHVGVSIAAEATGACAIEEIEPRYSKLSRRAPGGAYGERVLAANVDEVVVVFAAARPEPHPRMLDRFLVIAEANGLAARVVVNKLDIADEAPTRALFAPYEQAQYPVHYVSVKRGDGVAELRAALQDRTSVLTGPSGVGKSSLLNAMFPGLNLRVGEISESVNKGRHTTVGALMVPLPDATGYIVDTPGLREVGLWDLPVEHLDRCFPELRGLADDCRFGDCSHVVEPDCAVLAAVERGAVSRARYESYLILRDQMQ